MKSKCNTHATLSMRAGVEFSVLTARHNKERWEPYRGTDRKTALAVFNEHKDEIRRIGRRGCYVRLYEVGDPWMMVKQASTT